MNSNSKYSLVSYSNISSYQTNKYSSDIAKEVGSYGNAFMLFVIFIVMLGKEKTGKWNLYMIFYTFINLYFIIVHTFITSLKFNWIYWQLINPELLIRYKNRAINWTLLTWSSRIQHAVYPMLNAHSSYWKVVQHD